MQAVGDSCVKPRFIRVRVPKMRRRFRSASRVKTVPDPRWSNGTFGLPIRAENRS